MNRINGTRFMKQEEMAANLTEIDLHSKEYPVGGIPLLVKDGKAYVDGTDSHSIIFGATGSKKTRMFAMPSIGIFAHSGESFIVTDPKGELYQRTAGEVADMGYNVCCLNLRSLREGVTWNPLRIPYQFYHGGKRAKAMEMITEFAGMVIGMDSTAETFWTNTAVDVLVGFIIILFERANPDECNLKSLVELWNAYIKKRKRFLQNIKDNFKGSLAYQKISSLDNDSERTVGSIEAFLSTGFNKLIINEELVCFLSQEGMDLCEVAKKKTAIYLVIPDENKSYHFIVSLFLEQFYEVLIREAQENADNALAIRMNFLIDEFANIPKMNNMDAMITAARSRNIRFHLIIQSMRQLTEKYGQAADIICSNCNNWIYLYSKEYTLLQEISRLCGEVIYDNSMKMPLFSEFDLQHLSKERGEALVLAGRNYPCISNLADINEYPYETKEVPKMTYQEWFPVAVFDLTEKKEHQYALPFFNGVMWEYEDPGYIEKKRWLVAVGPKGIIVDSKMVDERDLGNGVAISGMLYDLRYKKKIESSRLQWYSADEAMEKKYTHIMRMYPEMVYVTLNELGMSGFRRESHPALQDIPFAENPDKCYILKAKACIKEERRSPREDRIAFMSEMSEGRIPSKKEPLKFEAIIPDFGGKIGQFYALNECFRIANNRLKNTEYADISWVQYWDEYCRDELPTFQKRISTSNFLSMDFYLTSKKEESK